MKHGLLCSLLLLCVLPAHAATVQLAWDDTDQGQTGYKIYYGPLSQAASAGPAQPKSTNPAPYTQVVRVTDPNARSHNLELGPGTYFFRVTSFNEAAESLFSNEAQLAISLSGPKNARVTIITIAK